MALGRHRARVRPDRVGPGRRATRCAGEPSAPGGARGRCAPPRGRAVAGVGRRPGHGPPRGGRCRPRGVGSGRGAARRALRAGRRLRVDARRVDDPRLPRADAGWRRDGRSSPPGPECERSPGNYYVRRSRVGGHGNTAIRNAEGEPRSEQRASGPDPHQPGRRSEARLRLDHGYREIRPGHPWSGSLYGAIARLEERGLIEPEPVGSDERRRPYRITGAGRVALEEAVREMRTLADEGALRLGISVSLPVIGPHP